MRQAICVEFDVAGLEEYLEAWSSEPEFKLTDDDVLKGE